MQNPLAPIGRFKCSASPSCCKYADAADLGRISHVESLSYVPVRFDECHTMDMERSNKRYEKLPMHNVRLRAPPRSPICDAWLRGAALGFPVTLIQHSPRSGDTSSEDFSRVSAVLQLNTDQTQMTITSKVAEEGQEELAIAVLFDNITTICPVTDVMLIFKVTLPVADRDCVMVIQYVESGGESKHLYLLLKNTQTRDEFIQALTDHWFERRNETDRWY